MTTIFATEPPLSPTTFEGQFGACPVCRRSSGYLTVQRANWGYCEAHGVRWCMGNTSTDWQDEAANEKRLAAMVEVAPVYPQPYAPPEYPLQADWPMPHQLGDEPVSQAAGPTDHARGEGGTSKGCGRTLSNSTATWTTCSRAPTPDIAAARRSAATRPARPPSLRGTRHA